MHDVMRLYLEVVLDGRSRQNEAVPRQHRVSTLRAFRARVLDLVAFIQYDVILPEQTTHSSPSSVGADFPLSLGIKSTDSTS